MIYNHLTKMLKSHAPCLQKNNLVKNALNPVVLPKVGFPSKMLPQIVKGSLNILLSLKQLYFV